MTPIEAMARAICASRKQHPDFWPHFLDDARAALDALANNVNEKMTTTYLSTRVSNTATRNINALSIAAAIRAAGQE